MRTSSTPPCAAINNVTTGSVQALFSASCGNRHLGKHCVRPRCRDAVSAGRGESQAQGVVPHAASGSTALQRDMRVRSPRP